MEEKVILLRAELLSIRYFLVGKVGLSRRQHAGLSRALKAQAEHIVKIIRRIDEVN